MPAVRCYLTDRLAISRLRSVTRHTSGHTQRYIAKLPLAPSYQYIKMLNAACFWASTSTPLIILVHFPEETTDFFPKTSPQPPNQLVPGLFVWCAPSSSNKTVGYTSTSSYACKTCTGTILLLSSSTLFSHFRK
jgi:hypothetical protein